MKTLYLLRHAKSSWDDPGLEDAQRPLNRRGRRAAHLMAEYFRRAGIIVDRALCSTAQRARQTIEALRPALGEVEPVFDDRLYEASRQTLLARLAELPETVGSVLLVGHNPGLERLAQFLCDEHDDSPAMQDMREKFPTGSLAVLTCEAARWADLGPASCHLREFVRPSQLEDA